MADLLEEQRESWGTRGAFILAAIGSAVGLGNLWGFPYKLYSYGGGAFLIPYIIALFLVGIPIMILEFSIGHYTQRAAPDAFKRGHKRFEVVGWWGIILAFVIITYYPVILAYCFSFLWYSIVGIFRGGELPWAGQGIAGVENAKQFFNETYLGKIDGPNLGSIRWNIVWPLIITWLAMYFCIFKGVKLVGKIVWLTVPLPWLMLLILTVRGLTLEGSMQGLVYYLDPVWSELTKPITWRYAFGQVFFSLSLAYGVMVTYASFLHRKSDINNNAAIISIADFATSFIAGLAVFATLGGMAYVTQLGDNPVAVEEVAEAGPSLAFVAFPYALAQLPYSAWFSFVFFFALVTLGIDSAFSMTESILASIVDKTGWRRCIVLPVMSVIGFLFGLIYITQGGFNWLGTIDGFVNGTWGIAFMGLLECVVLGWLWRIRTLRRHANSRSDWRLGPWWDYLVRLVIPVVLGTLFFWQLFDDIFGEGFLRTAEGKWILPNFVGLSIVALVPVIALILSLTKGRKDIQEQQYPEQGLPIGGKREGAVAFVMASVVAVLFVFWFSIEIPEAIKKFMLWLFLLGGIFAMLLSNYVLDKHHRSTSQASWPARWAGILATMDASASIAIILIGLAKAEKIEKSKLAIRDTLSGVSYIILGVVFFIIIGGLGWCFYRALIAAGKDTEIQYPDEIGDEGQQN
ncbi:MAG: sodium-dependent transporter [Sedimentisphaerales bacterium]|nr:sodium-dependent transporter [Sedimentisphaerales bacterium]